MTRLDVIIEFYVTSKKKLCSVVVTDLLQGDQILPPIVVGRNTGGGEEDES